MLDWLFAVNVQEFFSVYKNRFSAAVVTILFEQNVSVICSELAGSTHKLLESQNINCRICFCNLAFISHWFSLNSSHKAWCIIENELRSSPGLRIFRCSSNLHYEPWQQLKNYMDSDWTRFSLFIKIKNKGCLIRQSHNYSRRPR